MHKSTNNNNYVEQKIRGLIRKFDYINSRGGKCEKCGYNKNLAALEFHHNDPKEKEFGVDIRRFSNTSLIVLDAELSKCALVCANCHRETHNEELNMDNIPNLIKDSSKNTFSNRSGAECPQCNKRFKKSNGKIFCSDECREKSKKYPTINELNEQYEILKSWDKVAVHFNITRKITQGIRKKHSN